MMPDDHEENNSLEILYIITQEALCEQKLGICDVALHVYFPDCNIVI